MRRAERRAIWAKHIELWKASGLTQRAYCEREAIAYDTFRRWGDRLDKAQDQSNGAVRFIPVSVQGGSAAAVQSLSHVGRSVAQGVEVRLRNGRSLVLGGAFAEAELGRLIRLLEELPC